MAVDSFHAGFILFASENWLQPSSYVVLINIWLCQKNASSTVAKMDVCQQIYCLRQEADSPWVPVKVPDQIHEVANSFWVFSSKVDLKK